MLQIAICDDEALHREYAATLVKKELAERPADIDCFDSAEALLRAMEAGDYLPDAAVLDIQMEGMDGIELAKRLNELAPECRVVFLTSYLDFATDVYETRHTYFVIKSQMAERMRPALAKALSAAEDEEPSIHYKSGAAAHILPVREVRYLERRLHRTRIVKTGGEDWTVSPPPVLFTPFRRGGSSIATRASG